jgi:hypothetical protein
VGKHRILFIFPPRVNFCAGACIRKALHINGIGRDMLNSNCYNLNQMLLKARKLQFELKLQKMPPSFEKRCCPLPDRFEPDRAGKSESAIEPTDRIGWARQCGF